MANDNGTGMIVDRAAYDIGPGDDIMVGAERCTVVSVVAADWAEIEGFLRITHDGGGTGHLYVALTDTVPVVVEGKRQ